MIPARGSAVFEAAGAVREVTEMIDDTERRDPMDTREKNREPRTREHSDPGEAEWVLERIQQTFDTPRA